MSRLAVARQAVRTVPALLTVAEALPTDWIESAAHAFRALAAARLPELPGPLWSVVHAAAIRDGVPAELIAAVAVVHRMETGAGWGDALRRAVTASVAGELRVWTDPPPPEYTEHTSYPLAVAGAFAALIIRRAPAEMARLDSLIAEAFEHVRAD